MATRAQITVNGVVGSDDDVTLDSLVQLNNQGLGDEVSYLWTILSQPSPMDVVLSSTTVQAPTFTPNKEGSYLIQLVVNKDLPDQKIDRVVVAVRELETRNRIPAAGETTENDAETGWANTAVDQILQRVTRFADAGIIVGKAGQADLQPFDVVYTEDVTTIATGLPGERPVPLWRRATAADAGQVLGLLGVFINGVDGSTAPATGDIIRVAVLEILQSVQLGATGLTRGTPVYVDNAGHLSITPGDTIRQVGTVLDDMGSGAYGIWVTGEGTFGTIQGVTVEAPLEVASGVIPNITLARTTDFTLEADALALSATGVTPDTYGEIEPAADESVLPTFTVDSKGRITAASEGAIHIGGTTAKVYVDAGDATTLAAAEAYTDARTFGLSSKVPVHTGTTIPLPACTVNGSFQTLTANVHGPLLPVNTDGHDLLVGERLLVKDQVAQANNGIYVLTQKGATSGPSSPWILTRADDANTAVELCGSLVTVNVGNTLAGTAWLFAYNPTDFQLGLTPVIWSQFNAVPATDSVLGTVRLQGGLGGLGSTAQTPIVNLGTGNVSDTLAADNGGTGLTGSGALNAFLVGNGSGGWTTRTTFASGILTYTGSTIASPLGLRGIEEQGFGPDGNFATYSVVQLDTATAATTNEVALIAGSTWGAGVRPATGKSLVLYGEIGAANGGDVKVYGGGGSTSAPTGVGGAVTLIGGYGGAGGGGIGLQGGFSRAGAAGSIVVIGGEGQTGATGGSVVLTGGASTGPAGDVTLTGGTTTADSAGASAGDINITGGYYDRVGGFGGNVYIQGGDSYSTSTGGSVYIRKNPNKTTGFVSISDAYINGAGTAGQVLTSNGGGTPPSWQQFGGPAGGASFGAFTSVASVYTMTLNDYLIYARGPSGYTVTLPDASTVSAGRMFVVKPRIAGITLAAGGAYTIDNAATIALTTNVAVTVMRTNDALANTQWILI